MENGYEKPDAYSLFKIFPLKIYLRKEKQKTKRTKRKYKYSDKNNIRINTTKTKYIKLRNQNINQKTQLMFLNSLVKSILLYGCHV